MKAPKKDIKQIVAEKGYDWSDYSKTKAVINLNKVLNNSEITIEFVQNGFIRTKKTGFKYNIIISLGEISYAYMNRDIASSPLSVLANVGNFINKDSVKQVLTASININCKCEKCGGAGVIPQFHYYCSGICFDCFGLGFTKLRIAVNGFEGKPKKSKGLTREAFYKKYYVSGNYELLFPKDAIFLRALALSSIQKEGEHSSDNHISHDNDFYYIHAPLCGRNDWYKIPKNEWTEFTTAAKKFDIYRGYSRKPFMTDSDWQI